MFRWIMKPFVMFYINVKYGDVWEMRAKHPDFVNNSLLVHSWLSFFSKRNSSIPVSVNIDGTPFFPHGPVGVFISKNARIGKNAVIFQQVTIGSNTIPGSNVGAPIIGDNCYIGAGAKIIGGITIGNNCRIGANACVYSDLPDNSVAVCSPTRIIQKNEILDNSFYSIVGDRYDFSLKKYVNGN